MFERHLSGDLAAYLDDALPADRRARHEAHLTACARCRAAVDEYQLAARLLRRLPHAEAPPQIWASIEAALDRGDAGSSATGPGWLSWLRWNAVPFAAAAALLLAAGVAVWQTRTTTGRPWDVVRLDTPSAGRMAAGEWIETNAASRALIRIGEIGTVDIAPNTRLQLVRAGTDEHRLNLARGLISAQITAPPRLFFVETASSTVVDLGCAYTMQVDEAGVGILRVTSGWASLEWEKLESIVPAGASAPTRPDLGPGTPAFDDATPRLREALLAFDYGGGGSAALDIVLSEARDRDTLTLWHLLPRVDERDRARVFDRMVAFAPLPAGVTRERALALDRETLTRWREELAWTW